MSNGDTCGFSWAKSNGSRVNSSGSWVIEAAVEPVEVAVGPLVATAVTPIVVKQKLRH